MSNEDARRTQAADPFLTGTGQPAGWSLIAIAGGSAAKLELIDAGLP